MQVEYTEEAKKDLKSLDRSVAKRIIKKIAAFTDADDPIKHAKPLVGVMSGLYRFRVGDYRVIFVIADNGAVTVLTILTIAHRKDIYR